MARYNVKNNNVHKCALSIVCQIEEKLKDFVWRCENKPRYIPDGPSPHATARLGKTDWRKYVSRIQCVLEHSIFSTRPEPPKIDDILPPDLDYYAHYFPERRQSHIDNYRGSNAQLLHGFPLTFSPDPERAITALVVNGDESVLSDLELEMSLPIKRSGIDLWPANNDGTRLYETEKDVYPIPGDILRELKRRYPDGNWPIAANEEKPPVAKRMVGQGTSYKDVGKCVERYLGLSKNRERREKGKITLQEVADFVKKELYVATCSPGTVRKTSAWKVYWEKAKYERKMNTKPRTKYDTDEIEPPRNANDE